VLLSLTSVEIDNSMSFVAVFQKPGSNCVKVWADFQGNISKISPNVKRVFGYSINDVIGNNVSMLCPEPHRSKHDAYIKRYNTFGNPRVLGVARNLTARHRNESTFPISLQVKTIHVGTLLFIVCCLIVFLSFRICSTAIRDASTR
jgi:PAS domain S-box-containing protein